MEFSRQEYWSGLPLPSPGDLPDPGIEPRSPALQADSLPSELPGKQHEHRLAVGETSGTVSRRLCIGKWKWSKSISDRENVNKLGKREVYSRDCACACVC